jgi:hypothetical protein
VKALFKPSLYLVLSACLAAVALLLLASPSSSPIRQSSGNHRPTTNSAELSKAGDRLLGTGSSTLTSSPAGAEDLALLNDNADLLPEEWESQFFEIFEDSSQSMQVRNGKLMDLATNAAAGVPSVQRAAFLHLAFGIPDTDIESFKGLIKSRSVPIELRLQLLSTVSNFRPESLVRRLAESLSSHDEPDIAQAARLIANEFSHTSH